METKNSNDTKQLTWNDIYQIFGQVLVENDFKITRPRFNNTLTRQYLKEKFKQNELYFNEAKNISNITKGLKIILKASESSVKSHDLTNNLVIQIAGLCFPAHIRSLIEDIATEQNLSPDEFTSDLFSKINYLVVTEPEVFVNNKVKMKNKIK